MTLTKSLAALGIVFTAAAVGAAPTAVEIAKVNGKSITSKDLQGAVRLSGLNEGQASNILRDPNSRREILQRLVDTEVLVQQAEKEKLDQDPEFKDAQTMFRRQYLSSRVLQKNLSAKLSEGALKKYFESNKNRFSTDQVYVQHILTADEPTGREMIQKAKAKDADFMKLAEQYSRDPSAKNNRGDVGFIDRKSPFVAEFKDAAFNAGEGDIIGPIKTAYGYHVIKVVKKKPGHALEFDEVMLDVREELTRILGQNYVGSLKQQAKIQIDDKALDKL